LLARLAFRLYAPVLPFSRRCALLASQGLWPRVLGRDRVPREGPLVLASGHFGLADTAVLQAVLPRPFEIVLNEEILETPLVGTMMRLRGAHPLRRVGLGFDEANARSLGDAAESARRGSAVAVFPQGFSQVVGSGAIRIASAAQAPLQPVVMYPVRTPRGRLRVLLLVGRPMPPPAPNARDRRAMRERLRRRLRARGGLYSGRDVRHVLNVVMDDPRLWREPLRVPRVVARLRRLPAGEAARHGRRARHVLRACARLRCSVGDLRAPPGLADALGYLVLVGPAVAGWALCSPLILALRIGLRRVGDKGLRRQARVSGGFLFGPFWMLILGTAGCLAAGAWGLLLPPLAVGGLIAFGLVRPYHRRCFAAWRVRRHGPRLRRMLHRFERRLFDRAPSA